MKVNNIDLVVLLDFLKSIAKSSSNNSIYLRIDDTNITGAVTLNQNSFLKKIKLDLDSISSDNDIDSSYKISILDSKMLIDKVKGCLEVVKSYSKKNVKLNATLTLTTDETDSELIKLNISLRKEGVKKIYSQFSYKLDIELYESDMHLKDDSGNDLRDNDIRLVRALNRDAENIISFTLDATSFDIIKKTFNSTDVVFKVDSNEISAISRTSETDDKIKDELFISDEIISLYDGEYTVDMKYFKLIDTSDIRLILHDDMLIVYENSLFIDYNNDYESIIDNYKYFYILGLTQ